MQRDERVLHDVLGARGVVDQQHGQPDEVAPVRVVERAQVDSARAVTGGHDVARSAYVLPDVSDVHCEQGCHTP